MKNIVNRILNRIGLIKKTTWLKITFILTGIASTIWFLVRVIPKPQRATYPCMRVAAPMMSGFVIYLLSLVGSVAAFKKAKLNFIRSNYLYGALFLLIALAGSLFVTSRETGSASAKSNAEWIIMPNQPVGTAKGIFPGRVVWVHDPAVAGWDGTTGNWWDENVTSQSETDKMMNESLTSLTGAKTEKNAWTALFKYFNSKHNRKNQGYKPGQKIAIKINTNNTYSHQDSPEINATPQLVLSLLKSLVTEAGIPQDKITVFDASRFITDNIFNKCHAVYPGVVFVDNVGGDGRTKSTYANNAIPYSVDNGKLATGLATCAVEADYLINMALLKGHVGQGVTLCAKNYYGVTSIENNWRKNAHNNFNPNREGKPQYLTFVDFMAHKDLGDKTMLFLIDGIYGSKLVNGVPAPKWKMEPFNNSWACSLLASQDPVAIDAVGLDFLRCEFPDAPDMAFSDQYLIEAALADNPPSKVKYDPQRNKASISSLGVMEHWNNAKEKKYSRNLGKKEGIELVQKSIPVK
ncbi:MAG: DUF362 domain-containing protein [Bacteroidales bacterium]|nr:DUF362 domain-containing protein [Bacteroidales bacterium]